MNIPGYVIAVWIILIFGKIQTGGATFQEVVPFVERKEINMISFPIQKGGSPMDIGNWRDEPCFYVSVIDGKQFGLLLGPFQTEKECRKYAYSNPENGGDFNKHYEMINKAEEVDAKSWFYSFGMVKMQNGHSEGVLNKFFDI